jgi:hypothetical protein
MAVTRLLLPDNYFKAPNTRDYTPEDGESIRAMGEKINARMVRSGLAEIDFGAFPGSDTASLAITGQDDIEATASVTVSIVYDPTDDHSADEHLVDPPRVVAGTIVAGTGFTIYGNTTSNTFVYGKWTLAWRWSN